MLRKYLSRMESARRMKAKKLLTLMIVMSAVIHASWAGDEKQIKLEDIERDMLVGETDVRSEPEQKELTQQPTQHIQLSYSNDPQDIFVTPQPRYPANDSPSELRTQLYHLPKVHESDQTYTVPAKQTLIQSVIGGNQPIQPVLGPQPQYIYVQSPQQHQPFMPQAHAFVMVPYASHYPQPQAQVHYQQPAQIHVQQNHHHPVLPQPQPPTPTPTVYSYSHGPSTQHHHQPSYQALKSLEYNIPSSQSTPLQTLQTSVDYKANAQIPIVPRKTLPSIATTSFQQYYSPGLEYHYTEALPITKLSPHSSYSYQHVPTHNYHTNYVPQAPLYSQYFQTGPSSITPSYNKHQPTGLLESYVPSIVTYGRQHQHQQQQQQIQQLPQHQSQFKNYYPMQYQQNHQFSSTHIPQHLFSPVQASSGFTPYPSQAYNTIQYSVPLPPYDHSKRSTSKATATLSVKAPKSD